MGAGIISKVIDYEREVEERVAAEKLKLEASVDDYKKSLDGKFSKKIIELNEEFENEKKKLNASLTRKEKSSTTKLDKKSKVYDDISNKDIKAMSKLVLEKVI